ncbi:9781_t:CDS:2 [Entrophospora sp. SA101]|nr:5901_t:CDS:2 [Entrophospora sp. SA101]CAJ0906505.1 9781_t:CDS:2 [Entrophospora sp. SA101]
MLDTQSDYFTPTTLANTSINTFTVTTPTSIDFNDQFENDDWKWEEGLRLIEEFGNWTSGNDKLDNFIQQTQLENPDQDYHLKWIPFENFSEVKFLEKGGFSTVFSAIWLDKTDQVWCEYKKKFIEKPLVVALKSLKNSQDLSEDFLDEIKRHGSLKLDGCRYLVHCHGITKNPETNEFMMVMNFADEGNLRNYIRRNMGTLKWKDVVEILSNIAMGLLDIHKNATFHKNLHCGNILKYSIFNIADFGLSGPSGTSNPKGVYGSLPLVAPEVLAEELVDILTTPYAYHRRLLGLDEDSLNGLEDINDLNSFDEILNSHITNVRYPVAPDTHPFAIYTSDFLLFPNLPAPTNSIAISDPSEEKDEPISSSPPFFSINNSNFLDQVNLAFEEYDTNFPPPELSEPETDNEAEDEIFIPPPSFPIMRRKSIAPQPVF